MKFKKLRYKMTHISVAFNFTLAVSKIGLGIAALSFFPIVSAFYNMGFGIAKYSAVREHQRISIVAKKECERLHAELKCYHLIGIMVFVSSLIFTCYSSRLFLYKENFNTYNNVVAIGIATVTFTEIGLAIKGILNARKNDELITEAIKFVNLASALISLVLTQTALMSFAQKGELNTMHIGISGLLFGIISAIIGLNMMRRK